MYFGVELFIYLTKQMNRQDDWEVLKCVRLCCIIIILLVPMRYGYIDKLLSHSKNNIQDRPFFIMFNTSMDDKLIYTLKHFESFTLISRINYE